jgi:hypothetical protein
MSSKGCGSSLPFEGSRIRATGASSSNWLKDSRSSAGARGSKFDLANFLVAVVISAPVPMASVSHEMAFCKFRIPLQEKLLVQIMMRSQSGIADGFDVSKTMNPCDGSGPRSLVDGRAKAELGEIKRR